MFIPALCALVLVSPSDNCILLSFKTPIKQAPRTPYYNQKTKYIKLWILCNLFLLVTITSSTHSISQKWITKFQNLKKKVKINYEQYILLDSYETINHVTHHIWHRIIIFKADGRLDIQWNSLFYRWVKRNSGTWTDLP